jgi:rod shape-determining protein MreD
LAPPPERLLLAGRLALVLLAAVALQTVLSARLTVLGVTPDFFVILVVLVALDRGSLTGAVFGFAAGLVADIVFLDPLGWRAFIFLLAGYAVGRYSEEIGVVNAWLIIVGTAGVSLASQALYGLFQFLMGPSPDFLTMVRVQMIPAALLDGLVAAPLAMALTRLHVLRRQPGTQGPTFR